MDDVSESPIKRGSGTAATPENGRSRLWHTTKSVLVTFKMSGNHILAGAIHYNENIGPRRALTCNGFHSNRAYYFSEKGGLEYLIFINGIYKAIRQI